MASPLQFDQAAVLEALDTLDDAGLDLLDFGVIAFDEAYRVCSYNACESAFSGLAREQVLGLHVFTELAQCMNNYWVAQRFEDATSQAQPLDHSLAWVLTWRMRPTPVTLRLLSSPRARRRYVLLRPS